MKTKFLFVTTFLIITASFSVEAQTTFKALKDTSLFKKNLQSATSKTSTIACDFVQEKHISKMNQPVISKGKFWFKRPSSIRWEYTEPYSSLIILSKKKAYVKDQNNSKEYDMESSKMFQNLGEVMFSFILGDVSAAEKNYKIDYKENNETYYVQLIPVNKTMSGTLTQIEMYFDKKDYTLTKITMYDSGSDFTSIWFKNKTINKEVSGELFKLK